MLDGEKRNLGCQFGRSLIMLEHDGSVHPCMNAENIKFGNILTEDVKDIWFSKKTDALRKQLYENHCDFCQASCGINPYKYLKYAMFNEPIKTLKNYFSKWGEI